MRLLSTIFIYLEYYIKTIVDKLIPVISCHGVYPISQHERVPKICCYCDLLIVYIKYKLAYNHLYFYEYTTVVVYILQNMYNIYNIFIIYIMYYRCMQEFFNVHDNNRSYFFL